jgi:4-hydroxy-2-oxoheptanedioate aldolase
MRTNRLRGVFGAGRPIFGMAVYTSSPILIEVIGHSGFDFVFIDSEHTPLGADATLEHLVRAADCAGLATMLRVKSNDEHQIRNALELGVDGVCVPHIRTAEDARHAVRAAKFPPQGVRGAAAEVRAANYGAGAFDWQEYVRRSNEDSVVIALAEDKDFFDNIDDILAVEGLDMVNFGPTDLAMSLGLPMLYRMDVPEIDGPFTELLAKAADRGIKVMCPGAPPTREQVERLIGRGIAATILRNDVVNFRLVCQQYADQIMAPLRERR